jgi:hypothetical protein
MKYAHKLAQCLTNCIISSQQMSAVVVVFKIVFSELACSLVAEPNMHKALVSIPYPTK